VRRKVLFEIAILCGFAVANLSFATAPYNSPVIDGNIGSDWGADELLLEDAGDSPWDSSDLTALWLTWDAGNLYFGFEYSISVNGVVCYIDCGSGGSVSFRSGDGWAGAWPRDVTSERDIEVFMGAWNGSAFEVYRATPTSSSSIGDCLSATGGSFESEVAIPWASIFSSGFPVGAEIAVAVLLVGEGGYFAGDAIPNQPTVGDGEGPDNIENFEIIALDADSDGVPDFDGTYIGGTVQFTDVDSPPYPIATIEAGGFYANSSSEDGSWRLFGFHIGETTGSIIFTSPGYDGVYHGSVHVTDPQIDTLTVTLEPFTGAISGTIIPASECSLVAFFTITTDSGEYTIPSLSDSMGTFVVDHLASTYWSVTAFPISPDYSATTVESVLVIEPDTTEIEIILEAASVLREWNDTTGDDYGPGSYIYPTDNAFVDGSFDIIEVRIKDFSEAGIIEFEIVMGDLAPREIVDWTPYYPPLNTQKIDIYIDAHGGGSNRGLPNRFVNFVPTDYWDWAISVDGWWVGMFASNDQSIEAGYTQNVTAVNVSADTSTNIISVEIDKSAFVDNLGIANFDEFEFWDFIVLSLGHDGDGVGGVRWVNPGSASQWNFGGGADGEIDPNVIDMSVSAGLDSMTGLPKEPTDPQESQLDWNIKTPVELSAHRPVDITPPSIVYETDDSLLHLMNTLHLLIRAGIEDDISVENAMLHYSTAAVWDSVEMGFSGEGSIWFGDIAVEGRIDSISPIASSLEFYFTAEDPSGNIAWLPDDGDSTAPDYPFALSSDSLSRIVAAPATVDSFICVFDTSCSSRDSLIFDPPSGDRVAFATADLPNFPTVPATVIVKYPDITGSAGDLAELSAVRRDIEISGANADLPIDLRLHWLDSRLGQWESVRLSLTEFGGEIATPRPYGGTYYQKASVLSGSVRLGSGLWAVGRDLRALEDNGVLRNIKFSPNPFSPNGDGIYDRVAISWETGADGNIDIDIYNLNGDHIARIARDITVREGKSDNIWWDGSDLSGGSAPAGIYAVRFELTYISAGVELRIRENRPLVVIK